MEIIIPVGIPHLRRNSQPWTPVMQNLRTVTRFKPFEPSFTFIKGRSVDYFNLEIVCLSLRTKI